MSPVIVLTTVGGAHDARALARTLVERRLVACVNIVDRVLSVYRWKDAIEEEAEQLLVMKTTESRLGELQRELTALHPYELPEFIVLPVTRGSEAYLAWLAASTEG